MGWLESISSTVMHQVNLLVRCVLLASSQKFPSSLDRTCSTNTLTAGTGRTNARTSGCCTRLLMNHIISAMV